MDSEMCTSCGRAMPPGVSPVVRGGRVMCADCAILEAAQDSGPARPTTKRRSETHAAPRKPSVLSQLQAASRWTPISRRSNRSSLTVIDMFWVAIYIAGLVASLAALDNIGHLSRHLLDGSNEVNGNYRPLSFNKPAIAGPCRVSVERCYVSPSGFAQMGGTQSQDVSIVLKIHNTANHRVIKYKSWRIGGVRAPDLQSRLSIVTRLEKWLELFVENKKNIAGFTWSGTVINRPVAGFNWTTRRIQPHRSVYDVLEFTVGSSSQLVPLLLSARNLNRREAFFFIAHPHDVGNVDSLTYAFLNRNIQNGGNPAAASAAGFKPVLHPGLPRVLPNFNFGAWNHLPPVRNPRGAAGGNAGNAAGPGRTVNSAGVFNGSQANQGPAITPIPNSTITRWTAKPDPPAHPLHINLHGHVVIHKWLQPFNSSPQGYFLGGQTNFMGRFQHYYLTNLRSPSWRLAFATPMAQVTQAVVSPNGAYVAFLDTPEIPNAGPQLPGTQKHELSLWSRAAGSILWHQTFNGQSPYAIIGFTTSNNPLIRSKDQFATTFYKLSAKNGHVIMSLRVPGQYHMRSVCISPGGHYLAGFTHKGLHLWNLSTGKLAGLSYPLLTINRYQPNNRLAFSNNGRWLGAAVPDDQAGRPGFQLLMWNVGTGKLAAYGIYTQKSDWGVQEPAAHCFGCLGPEYGWQIGLKLIDSKTGKLYHRFVDPVRNTNSIDSQSALAWMPDHRHLVFAASAGSQWGYIVLKADPTIMAKQLASVRAGARRNDWKLGPLKTAGAATCARINLPDAPPATWSFKVKEPAIATSAVPVRVIRTRLLTTPQGGTGHELRIDSVRFAGASSRMALVAYRQFTVMGMRRETALWIDRVNVKSGSIRGSFVSPNPRAHLLDFGIDGRTMLLSTRDTLNIYRWPKAGPPKRIGGWRIGVVAGQLIQGNIIHGRLLPGQQVFTMSAQGNVVIWSIPDQRAESTFSASPGVAPVTDASRKLLAFTSFNGVYLINLTSGELIGPLKGPANAMGTLSFSPGGTHLAMLFGTADLAIWNLHTGAYRGRFAPQIHIKPVVPGVPMGYHAFWRGNPLQWLNGRYVLVNGRIFDRQNHRIIWRLKTLAPYFLANAIKRSYDRRCWTLESNGHNWLLVGVRLPTQKMLSTGKGLGPAALLVKPGDAISVKIGSGDFIGAEQKYLAAAKHRLRRQGFTIGPNQALVMTISCLPGVSQTQRYGQGIFGQQNQVSVTLNGRTVRWRLRKSGTIIWQQLVFFAPDLPGFLPPEATANPQAYLNSQFNQRFASQIQIPNLPRNIFPTQTAGAPVSVIGPRGLMSRNQARFFRLPGLRQ